jgi:hypothetical protein
MENGTRVKVTSGRSSVNFIEIAGGLKRGQVILLTSVRHANQIKLEK